jgi:ABC-type Zn uptake system ZnuABC Zn-binding protein ZnuA
MDPERAAQMAENIAAGLAEADPDHGEQYLANGAAVAAELAALKEELSDQLSTLSCRELITFHDGFAYFADAFDLDLLAAIEEEEGSEASAKDIVEIVGYVKEYDLPSIFVETNGSDATANAISRECGVAVHTLSMLMSGPTDDPTVTYSTLMRENCVSLLEALS